MRAIWFVQPVVIVSTMILAGDHFSTTPGGVIPQKVPEHQAALLP